jgi:hypothetical protein
LHRHYLTVWVLAQVWVLALLVLAQVWVLAL